MIRAPRSVFLAVMLLASCGSDPSSSTAAVRTVVDAVRGGATAAAPPRITRSVLAQVVTPVMLVTIDNLGQQALIAEVQTNRDVATWSSVDDITLSLRGGVIVATRGLGADLMAADVPDVSYRRRGGSAHFRVHSLLNGEDQEVRQVYTCTFRTEGPKHIDVVDLSYHVTHITETCVAGHTRFANDYYISNDQIMRKSRQWISPEVGFLTIEDVRR